MIDAYCGGGLTPTMTPTMTPTVMDDGHCGLLYRYRGRGGRRSRVAAAMHAVVAIASTTTSRLRLDRPLHPGSGAAGDKVTSPPRLTDSTAGPRVGDSTTPLVCVVTTQPPQRPAVLAPSRTYRHPRCGVCAGRMPSRNVLSLPRIAQCKGGAHCLTVYVPV